MNNKSETGISIEGFIAVTAQYLGLPPTHQHARDDLQAVHLDYRAFFPIDVEAGNGQGRSHYA